MVQRYIPLYLLSHDIKYALVPIRYDANLPTRPNHMYLDKPQEPSHMLGSPCNIPINRLAMRVDVNY